MPHQSKTDSGDRRAEHAACCRVQDRSRQHHGKHRHGRIGQSADADRRDSDTADQAFRSSGIDQDSARHLSDQGDDAGRGQNQADIDLCPFLRGEKHRDERAEAGLHVGDKEDEPIKAAQAASGRRQRRFAFARLLAARWCRRGGNPTLPIRPVAQAA
jgi:hypothetical protein